MLQLLKFILKNVAIIDVPEHSSIEGTLGIYKLNPTELPRDVFVWAYKRSTQRYLALSQTLEEPDPFRLKYRQAIKQTVYDIIKKRRNKLDALIYIQK